MNNEFTIPVVETIMLHMSQHGIKTDSPGTNIYFRIEEFHEAKKRGLVVETKSNKYFVRPSLLHNWNMSDETPWVITFIDYTSEAEIERTKNMKPRNTHTCVGHRITEPDT